MIARRLAPLALTVLVGCGAGTDGKPMAAPAPTREALASAAASLACPSVAGRVFTAATGHGDARDAFAELLACDASAEGATVHVHAVLAAWVAVSMDAAGARVDQYLHATVTLDARYALAAQYVGGRLVVRLRPPSASRVSVTPVGAVDVAATNWVALALGELAPTRGTTPEWVAKDKIREIAERMLHEKLDRELEVCLDLAHDAVAADCGAARVTAGPSERTTLWVAPHGTALLGPFPANEARPVVVHGDAARVVVRPLCLEDLAVVLARDRRGEDVPMGEWAQPAALPTTPVGRACAWGVAVRLDAGEPRAVAFDVGPPSLAGLPAPGARARRWVALHVDDAAIVQGDAPTELWLESATEQVRLDDGGPGSWVGELAAADTLHLRVRAVRRGAVLADAEVVVGNKRTMELRAAGTGVPLGHATIDARAVPAPKARP